MSRSPTSRRRSLPSPDDMRLMLAVLAAWNGARVSLTAEEWERAERLLESQA